MTQKSIRSKKSDVKVPVILELRGQFPSGHPIEEIDYLKEIVERGFTPTWKYVVAMPSSRQVREVAEKKIGKSALKAEAAAKAAMRVDSRRGTPASSKPFKMKASIVVAGVADRSGLRSIESHRQVLGVYADPEITPHATNIDCNEEIAKGTIDSVAKYVGATAMHNRGYRGNGIGIGICDTGVQQTHVPIVGGWTPNPTIPVGTDSTPFFHGTMTAFGASNMAPNASIYDIGVLKPDTNGTTSLSSAFLGFEWAITQYLQTGQPQVLSNSWGLFQESNSPQYANDPNHVFTRKVLQAISYGMIVTFSAGNCGSRCPYPGCGTDVGPEGAFGEPMLMKISLRLPRPISRNNGSAIPAKAPRRCTFKNRTCVASVTFRATSNNFTEWSVPTPVLPPPVRLLAAALHC